MKLPPAMVKRCEELAGIAPKPRRKASTARVSSWGGWSITLTLNTSVVSCANRRDHWTTARRRAELQCEALRKALAGSGLENHVCPLPVVVTWVRIGRQMLDDDNLASSFKALRDALAKWLQCDDGDTSAASWATTQRTGGEPGVEVTIRNRVEGNP